jgi:nucleoside-diphosphate-sugar epimerase
LLAIGAEDLMSVLLTGGAGYIGSHTALALLDAGLEVVVVDDLSNGFSWLLPTRAQLYVGDYGDERFIAKLNFRAPGRHDELGTFHEHHTLPRAAGA